MNHPDYLGDAVYAHIDDTYGENALVLTTDHHDPARAGNVIYVNQSVLAALLRYLKRTGLIESEDGKQ